MIRLLYTINGLRVNGMSAVIMQYIAGLDPQEYKISLFTDEIAPQFRLELNKHNVEIITSGNRRRNQLAYYKELKQILKEHQFDIIHAHGNSATLAVEMLAAKKCGVKVRIAHSHNTTCVHKVLDKMLRPVFYKCYTHGIGCGVEAGRWLFGSHPHVVIKNGVNLKKYAFDTLNREAVQKELGILNKRVIGHIGRFTEQKNHDYIIDVFELYHKTAPDTVLILAGDGPRFEEIKQRIKEKGLDDCIILYGTTPNTSVLYSSFDVFIFPSLFEGVPLTLIEAQANGVPCLISDKISSEVILTDLIHVLPLSEPSEWVKSLQTAELQNRQDKSIKAVKVLESAGFEIDSVLKQIDDFYKSCLGSKQ